MKAKYKTVWILVAFIGLLSVLVLNASALVQEKDLKSLTDEANTIVMGEVIKEKSYWEDGKIFTDVTISTKLYLKGAKEDKITVKIPGGTVNKISAMVSDTPSFENGEETLLFLKDSIIVGSFQGKYTIKDDKVLETGTSLAEFIHEIKKNLPKEKKGKTKPTIDVAELKLNKESIISIPMKLKQDITNKPSDIESCITIKSEGFEGAFPNDWTLYGDPTWCDTSYRSYSGLWSGWCACGGSSGVPAGGNYPNNVNAWMVYGPFDLSDAQDAYVTFQHWTKTETSFDFLKYMASTDGTNFYGAGLSGDWTPWEFRNFDLTNVYTLGDLCGEPQVWIAFIFTSDSSITYEGSFLDEISITKCSIDEVTIIDITPNFGPARAANLDTYEAASDSTQVTVSGSGFGSTPGSLEFWRLGATYIDASIESWNDNQIIARVAGGASSYYMPDGSGNVYAVTSGGEYSNDAEFYVTYSYGGGRWPGNSVAYFVNPNTADTIGELEAVQDAAHTWNITGADFVLNYGGISSQTMTVKTQSYGRIWVLQAQ